MGKPDVKLDPVAALRGLKVVPQIFYGRHLSEGYLNTLAIKDGVVVANNVQGQTLIIASYERDRMIDCKVYPNTTGSVQTSTMNTAIM